MIFISTSAFPDLKPAEAARRLSSAGLGCVELSGGKWTAGTTSELEELADRVQFRIHHYFPPPQEPFVVNLASPDTAIAERSLNHVRDAIRLAKQLGSPVYSVHAGYLIDPHSSTLGQPLSLQALDDRAKAMDRFLVSIEIAAEFARGFGIRLLIENNVLTLENLNRFGGNPLLLTTAQESLDFVKNAPKDVGLLVDVGHLKVSARTLGFDSLQALADLSPHTGALHLSDNDGTNDTNDPVSADSWFWPALPTDVDYISLEVRSKSPEVFHQQVELTRRALALTRVKE